jgi:hypothetical protein
MELKINCDTGQYLHLSEMAPLQGALKHRTDTDYAMLQESLETTGLVSPFYIWPCSNIKYILDGHARHYVLSSIDDFRVPVVYVDAVDIDDAKSKLLNLSSAYGKITARGLASFSNARVVVPTHGLTVIKSGNKLVKTRNVPVQAKNVLMSTITLQMPMERVSAFLDTIEQVDYITILRGGKK